MCKASAASDFICRDKAKIIELQRCGGQGFDNDCVGSDETAT